MIKVNTERISFIIPAYNCSTTVEEAVNSIIEGNFEDGDEIVIVNDGSTDDTHIVLRDLASKFPAIRIVSHKFNKGGGAARNTAVENTTHDLIFCLDSDNILVPGSIGQLKSFLAAGQLDAVAFQEIRFFKKNVNEITHHWVFKESAITFANYLSIHRGPGDSGNYMYTRSSWLRAKGYPVGVFLDTWGFGLRQVATGSRIAVLPDSYYFHRHGHKSYWVREHERGKTSLVALQILIPFFPWIEEEDIEYMMSKRGRYTWFENKAWRPIRVLGRPSIHPFRDRVRFDLFSRLTRLFAILRRLRGSASLKK